MGSLKSGKREIIIGIIFLAILLASCIYRRPVESNGFYNSDATYHVLLTMQSYDDSPFSVHALLPIQTYGAASNKFINNGPSLIQDANGNSFYVSFSPMGFYAPYLFCKLLHLPLTANSIYLFNCVLMLICAALCSLLIYKALGRKELSAIAFIAYIFIPEVLFTQGIVYWNHSLSQVFLLLQLVIFTKLRFENPKNRRWWQILFLIVSFIYPYLEWTGFISNVGFALCLFIEGFSVNNNNAQKRRVEYNHVATSKIVLLGATTIAALGYYLWRFSKVAPVKELISTMSSRASSRLEASYSALLKGYWESYKPLLVLTIICLVFALLIKQSRTSIREVLSNKKIRLLLIAAFFPLLENVVMTEHAIDYTFDRLKFAPFLILVLAISCNALMYCKKEILNVGIIVGMIAVSIMGLSTYDDNKFVDLGDGYKNSIILRDYLNENYLDDNSAIIAKRGWRAWGYIQTMYHRNMYCTDLYPDSNLIGEAQNHNCQYIIYLTEGTAFWDTGVYDYAEIYDINSGKIVEVSSQTGKIRATEKDTITASSLTDANWTNGILNSNHRTVLFENNIYTFNMLNSAREIMVGDEKYEITSIDHDDQWIHIVLDREADSCSYPNELHAQ